LDQFRVERTEQPVTSVRGFVLLILLSLWENIVSLPKVGQGFLMAAEEKGKYF
jgi:hypothetical protein